MPTIEKLLNTDWKEKFLGKGLQGSVNLKGDFFFFFFTAYTVHTLCLANHYVEQSCSAVCVCVYVCFHCEWFISYLFFTDTFCLTTSMCVCVYRNPRESGREGASVVVDDKPALWSARAAVRSSFWAEKYGCSTAGETAATDGIGKTAARTGVEILLADKEKDGAFEEELQKSSVIWSQEKQ